MVAVPARVTVQELQQWFPPPVPYSGDDNDEEGHGPNPPICTGGTLVMVYAGKYSTHGASIELRFPGEEDIAKAIRWATPSFKGRKGARLALSVAEGILEANDNGEIELAWAYLQRALTWDGKDETFLFHFTLGDRVFVDGKAVVDMSPMVMAQIEQILETSEAQAKPSTRTPVTV